MMSVALPVPCRLAEPFCPSALLPLSNSTPRTPPRACCTLHSTLLRFPSHRFSVLLPPPARIPVVIALQGSVWRSLNDKASSPLNGAGVNGEVAAMAGYYNNQDSFYYLYVAGPAIFLRNAVSGSNSPGLIAWKLKYPGSPNLFEWIGVATADAAQRTPLQALMVSTNPINQMFFGGAVGADTAVSPTNRIRLAGRLNLTDGQVGPIAATGGFNGATVNGFYQFEWNFGDQEYWFMGNFR